MTDASGETTLGAVENAIRPELEHAERLTRFLTIAHSSFEEIKAACVPKPRKLRRFNGDSAQAAYEALPDVADACSAINLYIGEDDTAARIAAVHVGPHQNKRYRTAQLVVGHPQAVRLAREELTLVDGESTMEYLVELAAAGEVLALHQLGDDMRTKPILVSELRQRGVKADKIAQVLPPIKVNQSVLSYGSNLSHRKREVPLNVNLQSLAADVMIGKPIQVLLQSNDAVKNYEILSSSFDARQLNAQYVIVARSRYVILSLATAYADSSYSSIVLATERKLLEHLASAGNIEAIPVSALDMSVFENYGIGYLRAVDAFDDLTQEEKVEHAEPMFNGALRAGEFEFAERLLSLITDPSTRLKLVCEAFKWMRHKKLDTQVALSFQSTSQISGLASAEAYSSTPDEKLVAAIFGITEMAVLDTSSDLETARRMVEGIANPGLKAKAAEQIRQKEKDLDELRLTYESLLLNHHEK